MAAFGLLTLPVWGVLASIAFYDRSVWLGVLGVFVDVAIYAYWMRTRLQLARDMSEYLGFPVTWQQIPHVRDEEFDAWVERKRSGSTRKKRWGFGVD
jgi:hypothetical protein